MADNERDGLAGTAMAAMTFAQLALHEVMKLTPENKARILASVQQLADLNKRGAGANKVAAQLMQSWVDSANGMAKGRGAAKPS